MADSTALQKVVAFLLGEGELDGVWFGEKHPTERGNFWWRKHLRAAFERTPIATSTEKGLRLPLRVVQSAYWKDSHITDADGQTLASTGSREFADAIVSAINAPSQTTASPPSASDEAQKDDGGVREGWDDPCGRAMLTHAQRMLQELADSYQPDPRDLLIAQLRAELEACKVDAGRYRWLRDQFELNVDERNFEREVSRKGSLVTYENVRGRWCIYELQEGWRFGEQIDGDREPRTFDAAIDAAIAAEGNDRG